MPRTFCCSTNYYVVVGYPTPFVANSPLDVRANPPTTVKMTVYGAPAGGRGVGAKHAAVRLAVRLVEAQLCTQSLAIQRLPRWMPLFKHMRLSAAWCRQDPRLRAARQRALDTHSVAVGNRALPT